MIVKGLTKSMPVRTAAVVAGAMVVALAGGRAMASDTILTAALGDEVLQLIEDQPKVTRIVVNEKTVFEDRESHTVAFYNAYQVQGRWMVLFQHEGDAKDCPARYRVLDLSGPAPRMSLPFGTCSKEPEVATADGVLTVSMPNPAGGPAASWTYRDGRISRTR
ncbi:hypothetical protein DEW08_20370 [Azospirillum thermophilum]|uniref:Uncharacterized protein n=1 Tax=Azospirillum thermophilum TaxID=2202148 RepID=A0A2S2CVA6_9PROT|nr:hypothetical protein DEW08_20370 [Azospirillum thermophilum]